MLEINAQAVTEKIVDQLKRGVQTSGFEKVIIGLSGGIDSATAAFLAVKALGKENVLLTMFPYGVLHSESLADGQKIADALEIPSKNIFTYDIKKAVDEIVASDEQMNDMRQGNIMARVRMIYLYDMAKKYNALVCGTENKSEYYLGYFTRYGDEASDIEPIRSLYKTQVVELARFLSIPQEIINKSPTAGHWEGQTDEKEFGFTYKDADTVLYQHIDKHMRIDEIVNFDREWEKVVIKVLTRVKQNEFKHMMPLVCE